MVAKTEWLYCRSLYLLDSVEMWVRFATIFSSNECPVSLVPCAHMDFSGYLLEKPSSYLPVFLFSRVMGSQFMVKFPELCFLSVG